MQSVPTPPSSMPTTSTAYTHFACHSDNLGGAIFVFIAAVEKPQILTALVKYRSRDGFYKLIPEEMRASPRGTYERLPVWSPQPPVLEIRDGNNLAGAPLAHYVTSFAGNPCDRRFAADFDRDSGSTGLNWTNWRNNPRAEESPPKWDEFIAAVSAFENYQGNRGVAFERWLDEKDNWNGLQTAMKILGPAISAMPPVNGCGNDSFVLQPPPPAFTRNSGFQEDHGTCDFTDAVGTFFAEAKWARDNTVENISKNNHDLFNAALNAGKTCWLLIATDCTSSVDSNFQPTEIVAVGPDTLKQIFGIPPAAPPPLPNGFELFRKGYTLKFPRPSSSGSLPSGSFRFAETDRYTLRFPRPNYPMPPSSSPCSCGAKHPGETCGTYSVNLHVWP